MKQESKMQNTVYALYFLNDGNEWEDYGVFATREAAQALIAETQTEYGADVFADECWHIAEHGVA